LLPVELLEPVHCQPRVAHLLQAVGPDPRQPYFDGSTLGAGIDGMMRSSVSSSAASREAQLAILGRHAQLLDFSEQFIRTLTPQLSL
jgi:hypothetical protein